MSRARTASVAIAALALFSLAGPAGAQEEPVLRAEAALPDGRAVQLFALPGGYRLDIGGALWSGGGDGSPINLAVGDVDGDGAADVSVIMTSPGGSARAAEVWDVSYQGPMLMHVSRFLLPNEPALAQLRREVEGRFSLTAAIAALQYASETVTGGEADIAALGPQLAEWLETGRGALIYAEVARARAAAAAARGASADAALIDLRLALEARAKFAAGLGASGSAPVLLPPPPAPVPVPAEDAALLDAAARPEPAAPLEAPLEAIEARDPEELIQIDPNWTPPDAPVLPDADETEETTMTAADAAAVAVGETAALADAPAPADEPAFPDAPVLSEADVEAEPEEAPIASPLTPLGGPLEPAEEPAGIDELPAEPTLP